MNDFDYDVYQKKRIASGDRHRKRGSKSKYCGLPSDHMTQAQWEKQNGEVKVMNLSEPMSWERFKAMPLDLQKEYIQKTVSRFHCNMRDLARLFSVQPVTVGRKIRELGIDMALFPKGKRQNENDAAAFQNWLTARPEPPTSTPAPEPRPETPTTERSALAAAERFYMEWSWGKGEANLIEVLNLVHEFTNGDPIRLRVTADRL